MKVFWALAATIVFIAAGVFYAIHRGVFGFCLDTKIKPYEILNLTLTLLVALILQYYFAGKARDSRAEKDILISAVKEVILQLRKTREIILSCQDGQRISEPKYKEILSALRNLANELNDVEFVLTASHCNDCSEQCRSLRTDLFGYKAAVTGAKFPAAYTQQQISDEIKAFRRLHNGLHTMLFDINKHS